MYTNRSWVKKTPSRQLRKLEHQRVAADRARQARHERKQRGR